MRIRLYLLPITIATSIAGCGKSPSQSAVRPSTIPATAAPVAGNAGQAQEAQALHRLGQALMQYSSSYSLGVTKPATRPAFPLMQPVIIGRVLDAAGRPASGATVEASTWVLGQYLKEALSRTLTTHTDAQGRYSLRLPFAGLLYSIKGEKDGTNADGANLVVYQDQQIDLHLESVSTTGKITGHLRTAAGRPAGGVLLAVIDEYGGTYHATSDASGDFTFTGLPIGSLGQATILAETPGDAVPLALIPPISPPMNFTLTASAQLHGSIDDAIDGKPLAGITVTIIPAAFVSSYSWRIRFTTTTDAKGNWRFDHIPPGSYVFNLESTDHFLRPPADDPYFQLTCRIRPGENAVQNFRMDRDAHIRGIVVDRNGNPIAGALACAPVSRSPDNSNGYGWAASDAQGHFDLPTGRVHENLPLEIGDGPFGDFDNTMIQSLEPGASSPALRIVLPGTVHITGTVVGPHGEPIANVWCEANAVGVFSDQRGRFDLGWLSAPGPRGTLITAEPPIIDPGWFSFDIGCQALVPPAEANQRTFYQSTSQFYFPIAGQTVSEKIQLKRDQVLTLHGRLVDLAGHPISNASMFLFAGTPDDRWVQWAEGTGEKNFIPLSECTTDARGNFSLPALRSAGERAGKAGERYAIGVVTGNEPRKLITNVVIAPDQHDLELKIKIDPANP